MAPNSSSMFNEAPAETKPASAPTDAPLNSPVDARPVSAVTSSSSSATISTECSSKQVAPKMEATIEDAATVSIDAKEAGASLRFARVSPVGLDDSKKTLTFRKSCLKRSSSFLPSSLDDIACEAVKFENAGAPAAPENEKEPEPEVPVQKNRRRCWECKTKLGLTAVTCRCDYTFCNKHRYAEEHNCRFNFKSAAKRKLEDENPRVVPSKVARIN